MARLFRQADWVSCRVWSPNDLAIQPNDRFDAWKVFSQSDGQKFGVGVEVEWVWNRVYLDFLKFWRAQAGGQIKFGVEILRGPSAFQYAVHHQYPLYASLIPEVRIAFCALDADDLREPDYEAKPRRYRPPPMP